MELKDIKSTAKQFSISVHTIRDYIKKEGFPHFKLQRKYLFDQNEVAEWFRNRRDQQSKNHDLDLHSIVNNALNCI